MRSAGTTGLRSFHETNSSECRIRCTTQVDNGDENVADARVPEFVHDSQPELGAFGVLDPQAENILRAVCLDAQGDVDRLVADHALVSDLDPHGVEEDERVTRLQRT